MSTRQHSILTHLKRTACALLPGGNWPISRFLVGSSPAGFVAVKAMNHPVMRDREFNRVYRIG